jgi:hypothetical protein
MSDIQKAIEVLNSAFAADPAAVHALICNRVPCNSALAEHPTVVVDNNRVIGGNSHCVGALGLINGVISELTGKCIAVKFTQEVDDEGRHMILGFTEYTGA